MAQLHERAKKSKAQPLTNAIVLVSYIGAGLGDMGTTSLAANQPRVLLHSTALNDLMQRNWLRRSARWVDALAILALIAAWRAGQTFPGSVVALVVLDRRRGGGRRPQRRCSSSRQAGCPGLVTTSAVWSLATFVELGRRQSYEFVQRLRLRATMGLYFSPHIMEHVLKNPGSMEPQHAELTLLVDRSAKFHRDR